MGGYLRGRTGPGTGAAGGQAPGPVAGAQLGDANATINVAAGSTFTLPAGTLTAARTLTLGVAGAPIVGELLTVVRLDATAFALTIRDDAGAALVVLPAGVRAIVSARWNGTHFADPTFQRLA